MPHATIHGARLWYQVRGSGEPILLHHGYTASRVNWMPVAERLERDFQVVLMECRGTGESEHTADGYPSILVHVHKGSIQNSTADIVEIDIHSIRAGFPDLPGQVICLVIATGIKFEDFFNQLAFVRPAGDADHTATHGLGNLPACTAN